MYKSLSTWLIATLVLLPVGLYGQDRADLIDQARSEFDINQQVELLWRAADPNAGPVDAVWSTAVHLLAQTLIEEGESELAHTWLLWGASVDASFPIDTVNLLPAVVTAIRDARAEAAGRAADPAAEATWHWSGNFQRGGMGGVEIVSVTPTDATLVVDGSELTAGRAGSLDPGTYEMVATAEGYEEVRFTREILPGVTTSVALDLIPSLPANLRGQVSKALVRVATTRRGETVCRTGFVASDDGMVVTSHEAVQDADAVVMTLMDGGQTFTGLTSVVADARQGLAVFKTDAPASAALVSDDDIPNNVWAFYVSACDGEATVAAAEIEPRNMRLLRALPPGAWGAPIVDGDGTWLGLLAGGNDVVPARRVEELLGRARGAVVAANTLEESQLVTTGGGVPWKWVGAGVGAVGITVALLAGGGGGDPGPDGGDTGGIIISLPMKLLGKLIGGSP